MMVIKKKGTKQGKIEIDLTGPAGNAFAVMGVAQKLAKQLGMDFKPIMEDMMYGDYEHLLDVMEQHFGDYIIMYR